jgi:glutamyl-tRNA synthetase
LTKANVITGTDADIELVKKALPLIQERIIMLNEVPKMLQFLFTTKFAVETESVAKITDEGSKAILKRSLKELETVTVWNHENIEAVLRASLIEEMALKPRIAFTALRIATTGSTISPPLFESMELLGKEACLLRINAGLAL